MAPVPLACRFSPWCRYWLMPSMWISSRRKADEQALSAKSARKNQSFCSMFGGVQQQARMTMQKMGLFCAVWTL